MDARNPIAPRNEGMVEAHVLGFLQGATSGFRDNYGPKPGSLKGAKWISPRDIPSPCGSL